MRQERNTNKPLVSRENDIRRHIMARDKSNSEAAPSSYAYAHLKQRASMGAAASSSQGVSAAALSRDRTAYVRHLESELARFAHIAEGVGEMEATITAQSERLEATEEQLRAQGKLIAVVQKFSEEMASGHRRDVRGLERKIAAAEDHLAIEPIFGGEGSSLAFEQNAPPPPLAVMCMMKSRPATHACCLRKELICDTLEYVCV